MTSIQRRAVRLAERVSGGELDPAGLCDADWDLLLLAAGLNNQRSLPPLVCRRVLDRAGRRDGFFADHAAAADGTLEPSRSDAGPRWAPSHN